MWDERFPEGVWLCDFEFRPKNGREGNLPEPVCMVALNMHTGETRRIWRDELEQIGTPPFPAGRGALFVAYYASAEMGCFLALGWPVPVNILDLFVEFRQFTNGKPAPAGQSLLGAMAYFGLDAVDADEKSAMRALILRGGPWNIDEQAQILEYCRADVLALSRLLPTMASHIDLPRALLRGQYAVAAAHMEHAGVPLDTPTLEALNAHWQGIEQGLVHAVDTSFGVFEGTTFKMARFRRYLEINRIGWPQLPSGSLDLSDDTFRDMAVIHPQLSPLRELRGSLAKFRQLNLSVGEDGRNRCLLSMFRSKTGRNQPSNSRFIFGPSVWLRSLIKPVAGMGLAYVDWSQQEFGIAAALSGDPMMMEAYRSGDPYLRFAILAGAVPACATPQSHGAEREQFKACVLAVQYGMGAENLAYRIKQPIARARQLLDLHRRTFKIFWAWSEGVLNGALLTGRLWTAFGWQIFAGDCTNTRSLRNFPMQANGAEMLRLACIGLARSGVRVCAPIHDAVLIEAPLDQLQDAIQLTQRTLRDASAAVLSGFELGSEAKVVRYPERYRDERGAMMWGLVTEQLGQRISGGQIVSA